MLKYIRKFQPARYKSIETFLRVQYHRQSHTHAHIHEERREMHLYRLKKKKGKKEKKKKKNIKLLTNFLSYLAKNYDK